MVWDKAMSSSIISWLNDRDKVKYWFAYILLKDSAIVDLTVALAWLAFIVAASIPYEYYMESAGAGWRPGIWLSIYTVALMLVAMVISGLSMSSWFRISRSLVELSGYDARAYELAWRSAGPIIGLLTLASFGLAYGVIARLLPSGAYDYVWILGLAGSLCGASLAHRLIAARIRLPGFREQSVAYAVAALIALAGLAMASLVPGTAVSKGLVATLLSLLALGISAAIKRRYALVMLKEVLSAVAAEARRAGY